MSSEKTDQTCFLDLFSGIGGFALGAEWAGVKFDKHYFSEVDDYAIRVYSARFPDAISLGDIKNISANNLPTGNWIIAGGFPCQDISVAGKGAGLDGARSGLWFEYARLIGELRPRYAIMENVGALTNRGLDRVLGSLAEIGYDAEWQDIRASDVGAPHRRERIWIVAYPTSISEREQADEADAFTTGRPSRNEPVRCREYADDVAYPNSEHGQRRPEPQQSASDSREPRNKPAWRGVEAAGNVADPDETQRARDGSAEPDEPEYRAARGPGWWTTEPDVGRVAHGVPSRVDRLKCLGNSIVPQIAELIFKQLGGG